MKKKRLSFAGGMLIYITVMLTLIFVGLAFWWHYLSCYETARAERVMDAYMEKSLQGDLEAAMLQYCDEHTTGYQTMNSISVVLKEALSGDAWHYAANEDASTEEIPVFTLYSGDTVVGQVSLSLGESSTLNMGFRTWGNPVAKFDFEQFGKTLTVTVPYNCDVYLSGQKLGEDAVRESIGIYPQLEAYESMLPQANQLLVYTVDNVFADVAVEYPVGFVSLPTKTEGVYFATPACDDTLGEQLTDYAKSFVRSYVTYTANAQSLWVLQQFLVPDSALYQKVTDDSQGKKWGEGVDAEIQTLEIENFVYYGNAITCDASYITKRNDGDRCETMKILMVNTNIGWRVMHIELPGDAPAEAPAPTETPAETPAPSAEPTT